MTRLIAAPVDLERSNLIAEAMAEIARLTDENCELKARNLRLETALETTHDARTDLFVSAITKAQAAA